MPDSILTIILVGVIGLIVLAILLKLCNRFPFLNYLFIFGSALALCIICFSVKPYNPGSVHDDKFKGAAAIWQAVLVAMYVMFLWADIAFDKYEYYEHTAEYNEYSNTITVTSKLQTASNFWSCLGLSLATGFGLGFLPHLIIGDSYTWSRILGFISIAMMVYWGIKFTAFMVGYIRAKKGYY
jgi:hypothetical protein